MASVLKRPLNPLQNPVYPVIQKAEPQFKDARKNNMIDVGRVMMEIEHHPDMTTWGVLVQSRDRNKQHQYGQSSHKTVVNKEFRPPLIDPLLDNLPLTRIPVKHKKIMPGMINPGNPEAYQAPNDGCDDVSKHITDDIKGNQGWRTNMVMPYEKDLEVVEHQLTPKITNYVSLSSGMSTQIAPKGGVDETPISDLYFANKLITSLSSGHSSVFQTPIYASNFFETESEEKLMPSVSAGFDFVHKIDGEVAIPNATLLEDDKLNPIMISRQNTFYTRDGETQLDRIQLRSKLPQGSLSSGMAVKGGSTRLDETPLQFGKKLNDRRVMYSSTSYADVPLKKQSATDGAKKNSRERKSATGNYYESINSTVIPTNGVRPTSSTVTKMNGGVKTNDKLKMNAV
jgi:hypothetical protein